MTQLGLVIDTKGCIGCSSCAMACKIENNLPDGIWWSRVQFVGGDVPETPEGVYPNLSKMTYTMSCQHCSDAACVEVCPTGATHKDEESGVVLIDQEACIGCGSCISACPFTGVRTLLESEPAFVVGFPVGDPDAAEHMVNTVEKCTLCYHRLKKGYQPACIEACPARARIFGDFDDPDSEVSKAVAERGTVQVNPEATTGPNVRYLA